MRLAIKARRFRGLVYKYKPWKERRIKRKARLKIEFSRGSSRLSTKTPLFSMIFDEGGFVRTLWYGRSRIWQKARKYRCFGGLKRNHLRLCSLYHRRTVLSSDYFARRAKTLSFNADASSTGRPAARRAI